MELNRQFYISQGCFICFALTNHNPFQTKWVGYVSIRMFFYNDLELSHEDYLERDGFGDAKYYTMLSTENQNDRAVWLLTPNGLP
jgi:hypothetical protein